ncbi:uncharacterized protein PODANS_1_11450 [Podospora anserina S mat+]|uniref:Podospora anserina S mat+ genomic DNA chromosome 1, supercontig 2 n=1 Tax=Podospora anserina (strain S / ATCC MYA-4624 / DSM 980 / FGSC 10383) TaxID=515849 RepID=B2AYK9_PODAN|nr:uncharacterized protein PODANS_1_11450 [Podospora anserina S mat+]CAP69483.1 unnamed protein product [Podospora anserina S mat+]
MSAPPPQGPGGFSLFPNTTARPPSRSQNQQRPPTRSGTPQEGPSNSTEASPPRGPRIRRDSSVREGKQRVASTNPWQHALDARESQRRQYPQESEAGPSNAVPVPDPVVETACAQPVSDPPQRCETAFSEAQTLVRSNSARSRSSIAKPPLTYAPAGQSSSSGGPSSSSHQNPPQLRSIFPTYNPELPLDRQEYYPKEASPTRIPQGAISRPLYSPRRERAPTVTSNHNPQSPPQGPIQSPAPTTTSSRWPRHQEPAVIPPVSSTEELRSLWKVTNGWKASSLEGRPFCLKLTTTPDAPVYTLSSSTSQPFYCLRIDPTSASALVSLSRYDPNKPFKQSPPSPNSGSPSQSPTPGGVSQSANIINSSPSTPPSSTSLRTSMSLRTSKSTRSLQHNAKNWLEVLTTSLTPPGLRNENDGLVAQLWPFRRSTPGSRPLQRRNNRRARTARIRAVSLRSRFGQPLPRPPRLSHALLRDDREKPGQGWLEVDTSIAAKIEAVYLVDVVVAALVLVAHGDDQYTAGVEVFEPPPVVFGGGNGSVISGDRRSSRSSRRAGGDSRASMRREEKQRKKEAKKAEKRSKSRSSKKRMEQFEIDLESQDSEYGKRSVKEKEEKLPAVLRALVWLIKIFFKCLIGSLALVFKCLGGIINGLARCCGLGKL